jgi:hypothetical protein
LRVFCTFLLLAAPCLAQEKPLPDAPKPKTEARAVFVAGVSLLAAAKTVDAITTRRNLNQGAWENNPAFGRHPSPAKQAGLNLGIFAAQSGLFYLTEHNRHSWIRWAGRAFIGYFVVDHAQAAACNAGLDPRAPGAQNCGPLLF